MCKQFHTWMCSLNHEYRESASALSRRKIPRTARARRTRAAPRLAGPAGHGKCGAPRSGVSPRLFPASPRGSAAAPLAVPRRRASALRGRERREPRARPRGGGAGREGGGRRGTAQRPRRAAAERGPGCGRAGGRACCRSVHRCRCFMRVGGRAGGTRLCPRRHSLPIPPAERPARAASPTASLSPGSLLLLLGPFAARLSPNTALVGGCAGAGRGGGERGAASPQPAAPARGGDGRVKSNPARPGPAHPASARPGSAHPAPRRPLTAPRAALPPRPAVGAAAGAVRIMRGAPLAAVPPKPLPFFPAL